MTRRRFPPVFPESLKTNATFLSRFRRSLSDVRCSVFLLLLVTTLAQAKDKEKAPPSDEDESAREKNPAISLLPEGSILESVLLPRYDTDRKLVSTLRSKRMILLTADQIEGNDVVIEFFNPDKTRRARIDLEKALYDQKIGIVNTKRPVKIDWSPVTAEGTGAYLSLDQRKGFLTGPAVTRYTQPPATAMNTKSPALHATALFGAAFLPLIAALPPMPPPAAVEPDPAKVAEDRAEAAKNSNTELRSALEASDKANKDTLEFLEQADLLAQNSADAGPAPEFKPIPVKPDQETTIITCDGGVYFDANEGVLVYLKNVKVNDPRFNLDGVSELKIFFEKKPPQPGKDGDANSEANEPPPPTDAKKDDSKETVPVPGEEAKKDTVSGDEADKAKQQKDKAGRSNNALDFGSANLGDPYRIVATGAVHLLQKGQPPDQTVEASGRVLTYNIKTGDIVISDGRPWIIKGTTYLRAKNLQAVIRIDRNFNFSTVGPDWEAGAKINSKDASKDSNKPKSPEKPKATH